MKLWVSVFHMHLSALQDNQDLEIPALFFGKMSQDVGKS